MKKWMEANGQPVTSVNDAIRRARNASYSGLDDDPDPFGYLDDLQLATGLQLLPAQWHSEPDDKLYVHRRRARARRQEVADLYLKGHTNVQIATLVDAGLTTVKNDIESITREWRETYLADIEILAARDLARLDEMMVAVWPQIALGQVEAIHAGISIIKERGAILGYRQGIQVDIEQHIREVASANGFDENEAVAIAQRISVSMRE